MFIAILEWRQKTGPKDISLKDVENYAIFLTKLDNKSNATLGLMMLDEILKKINSELLTESVVSELKAEFDKNHSPHWCCVAWR